MPPRRGAAEGAGAGAPLDDMALSWLMRAMLAARVRRFASNGREKRAFRAED
ncbi:hypothetical protein GCM10009429_15020 [Dyella marensis]